MPFDHDPLTPPTFSGDWWWYKLKQWSQEPPPERTRVSRWLRFSHLLAWVVLVFGGLSLFAQTERWDAFRADNAYGATANAAQAIEQSAQFSSSMQLFMLVTLILIYARLGAIRDALAERNRVD